MRVSWKFLCLFISLSHVDAKIGGRIIGGRDSYAGQFPFAAAIHTQTSTSRFFCGGALLNNRWIITSAHCVFDAQLFTVQLGSNILTGADPDRQTFSTSEYVLHPNFTSDGIENDIALIQLRLPVLYNNYIQPINLPTVSLLDNTMATAIGWGQTSDFDPELSENLKFVSAAVLSTAECQGFYGSQISANIACLEGNYNEGTCIGDAGSPLIEYISRLYWIVGVSSFVSQNGCESTYPSGFTRTFPYSDWIRSVINS